MLNFDTDMHTARTLSRSLAPSSSKIAHAFTYVDGYNSEQACLQQDDQPVGHEMQKAIEGEP